MARQRPTRLVMGPCIVEIDRIVIREDQYQLEVNRCRNEEVIVKGNFGWVWPMWAGCPRIDQVNRCGNKGIIVKGNFGWVWPMRVGRPRIDRIVIKVNQCRNEEIIVKGNFGWVWPMWAGCPRVDVHFELNWCTNEEVNLPCDVGGDSGQDGQTDGQTHE
ncbi:hypothetical protein DPMN_027385 [Dreissena polymorpha]|uniref:Uncharacterized protein n=1 Tax=Dreissena polymorpha TaxID=45954 RepID=A0A9D4LTD9_DREPO|nr:hypothetical protein DPMN_027385 [Dreissena polymorpha]